ncbi:MAG: hypothetical protein JKX81_10560 [Arenicella sp.]|nr:hypothetical protein [Arenicella sp.]
MTLAKYRMLVLVITVLGLAVPIFDVRIVFVMTISQVFNAVILPITVAYIFYLSNRKDPMREHKNIWVANRVLASILLFLIFASVTAIGGVRQMVFG